MFFAVQSYENRQCFPVSDLFKMTIAVLRSLVAEAGGKHEQKHLVKNGCKPIFAALF